MMADSTSKYLSKAQNIRVLAGENQRRSRTAIKDLHIKGEDDKEAIARLQGELEKAWEEIGSLKKELDAERKHDRDAKMDEVLDALRSIKETLEGREKVIMVREISDKEAMSILRKEILPTAETLSTGDIADALGIPLRQAHTLYLQLIDEGILKLD